jgi:hypothetical protein
VTLIEYRSGLISLLSPDALASPVILPHARVAKRTHMPLSGRTPMPMSGRTMPGLRPGR